MNRDELALGFVLGSLTSIERDAVERERLSDPALDEAIIAEEARLAPLTGLAGRMEPSQGLFDRITRSIAADDAALGNLFSQDFADGDWQPYLPGIETKDLWSSKTFLMRCRPGARVPSHPHPETEHLIVVSGDLRLAGRVFRTGDWHSAPANTNHAELYTVHGCVLLVHLAA